MYYPHFDAAVVIPKLVQLTLKREKVEKLEWFHDQGCLKFYLTLDNRPEVFCEARTIVHWLHEHARGIVTKISLVVFCTNHKPRLELLEWVHERNPDIEFGVSDLHDAISNGHLHIAKWLHSFRPKIELYDPRLGSSDLEIHK